MSDVIKSNHKAIIGLIIAFMSGTLAARPQFGEVVEGVAVITQEKKLTQVHQDSERASIEWANFSLAEDETCEFFVPQPTSHTFNHVIGTQFSDIAGKIKSNGLVTLVNPAGIIYRPEAVIDVNGILSASANFEKLGQDSYKYFGTQGAIVHQGTLISNGHAIFVAPNVQDEGIVQAKSNVIYALATQATASLLQGTVLIQSESTGTPTFLRKAGEVSGATVVMDAQQRSGSPNSIINLDGLVQAKDITVTADHIVLNGGTKLDASVESGKAGRIRVGGDYKGKGELITARTLTFEPGAVIVADAIENGDGGRIILWSEVASNLHGYVSAQGGEHGGDGGFIETSSNSLLYTNGLSISTEAPQGEVGVFLMDPQDFKISQDTQSQEANHQSIASLQSALKHSNVVVKTSSGAGSGDIRVTGDLKWDSNNTLTLIADRHIDLSESILDEITLRKLVLIPDVGGAQGRVIPQIIMD